MANNAQYPGMQPLRPPVPLGPPHVGPPSVPIQFRPAVMVPAQQPQPYNPLASQQFQQVGFPNIGLPSHVQQYQFSQPTQQLPARPSLQPLPTPEVQANRPNLSASPQPLQNSQIPNNYVAGSSSYTFVASSIGQLQNQPASNACSFPATTTTVLAAVKEPNPIEKLPSEWLEHISRKGKKYYYNRKTKLSTWQKPLELMTPIERADATTDWREFKSPQGRKYYYNKVTNQSKWRIPDELKLAREQVKLASNLETQGGTDTSPTSTAVSLSVVEGPLTNAVISSSLGNEVVSSPMQVESLSPVENPEPEAAPGSPTSVRPSMVTTATEVQMPVETVTPATVISGNADTFNTPAIVSQMVSKAAQDAENSEDASGVTEEAEKDKERDGDANITASGEKTVQEPPVYENKLEAKIAFKALLESAMIGSDWTWDQAMRVIINDQRYGALRTLGERKQAFNEYLVQRKRQDVEERRARHKKAQEDFRKMIEESKELTSSMRWSKAISIFEDDERFKAVERNKEREDLYEVYMVELQKKERAKALEEYKRNKIDYLSFLKSCDFITASSQWRKVQDRLEADERCSRLEKFDRLEIFQEYLRDLEREEEEQMKLRMEEMRKAERKNRDEFRNLMEEHIASGMLTAETHWRDYCMKVKDLPAYVAVSSNTSGSTAKDLFEDVAEELQKQFSEDKAQIKDAIKLRKLPLSSTWTLKDFKAAILEDISAPLSSDINLRLVFEELLAMAKEKEEKEAKRRKRLADDFCDLLCTLKNITASSKWEDCKQILEDRHENRFLGEESLLVEIFEKYITELKEKAKEKERRRREDKAKRERDAKDRERKDKHNRERGRTESKNRKEGTHDDNADKVESYTLEENRRSRKDKDKRHRKRQLDYVGDLSLDEDERDRSKSSHRHSSERKKSKEMEQHNTSEPDSGSRHKRHKKDHHRGSHRNGDFEELRDRGFGEEEEVW